MPIHTTFISFTPGVGGRGVLAPSFGDRPHTLKDRVRGSALHSP